MLLIKKALFLMALIFHHTNESGYILRHLRLISVVSTYASDEVRGSINKSLKVGQVLYLYELETSAIRTGAYCPYAAIPYLGIDHLDGATCARAERRPHAVTSPLIVTCQH